MRSDCVAIPAPLRILPDEPAVDEIVRARIRDYARGRGQIDILEAGCGRRWPYRLDDVQTFVTGVDLDEAALAIRQRDLRDLDRAIVGDLHTVAFDDASFDIVYSAYVLEHLAQAEQVLARFCAWLKPDGLLILKFPDRDSVYGFVTRMTPFWVHVAYKRYLQGKPNAGKPGFGPYPTVHEPIIGRAHFEAFLRERGLIQTTVCGYGTLPGIQQLGTKLLAGLSLGRLNAAYYNLLYIAERSTAEVVAPPPLAWIAPPLTTGRRRRSPPVPGPAPQRP